MPQLPYVGNWVDYLRGKGVEAEVVERHAPWWKYQSTNRMVRLSGKNIDEIWIQPRSRGSRGSTIEWETNFGVLINRPLAAAAKRAVAAKRKIIKQNKFLGIFGGKVTDVRWVGGSIADTLNQDGNLQKELLSWARKELLPEIRIKLAGKSAVTIIAQEATLGGDDFEIYDRIAKHVREAVSAY